MPQLAILLACVVWSLGTIYMRNASVKLDLFAMVGSQMLVGGMFLCVVGLLRRRNRCAGTGRDPGSFRLAYLIVFSSCFAYLAYGWLARHATPAQVGTYSYVNPALAAVVGYVGLDERLSGVQIIGAADHPGRRADDQLAH